MKILIICNYSSGLYTFRGMLIQELIKKGHTVKALVPNLDDENEKIAENNLKKMHCVLKRVPMERRGMNPLKDFGLREKLLSNSKKDATGFGVNLHDKAEYIWRNGMQSIKDSICCKCYRSWNRISGKWNIKKTCN